MLERDEHIEDLSEFGDELADEALDRDQGGLYCPCRPF